MEQLYLIIIVLAVILLIWWYYQQEERLENTVEQDDKSVETELPEVIESVPMSWGEQIAYTDVDPSVHKSHAEFVNETSIWSSGANFTSVSDDNTSGFFTNFVGLNRPSYVPVGASARQVPDVDESVLMRNERVRFGGVRL